MNYCGNYNAGTSYNVGDVVVYTDGVPYILLKAAPAGTSCHDTLYWNRVQAPLSDAVLMFHTMLTNINTAIEDAETNESKLSAMIAPEYTKTTYAQGDHVTHNGKYYVCNTDIGTAEDWTAAHWTEKTVGGEIAALNGDVSAANGSITDLQGVVFDDKTLILNSSTTSSDKKWAITVDDSDGIQVDEVVAGE